MPDFQSVCTGGRFAGLTDEPLDEPPKRLAQALAREQISSERFFLMQHGETRLLKRDSESSLPVRPADRPTPVSQGYYSLCFG